VGPQPSHKPGSMMSGSTQPPWFSFDPEIESKRRAAQRGLEDTEENVKTKLHFGHTDLVQALKDLKTSATRKRQDLGRESQRGLQKLGFEEADANTRATRANQDFDSQLANIGRQFASLGQRQREGANAAGVLDSGTQAAAGAARARNQGLAEAPVNTARDRTNEDLYTALSRIGGARGAISEDTARSLGRLGEDLHNERHKARQQFGREGFEGKRELGRARREGAVSNVELIEKEIYNARTEHPAVFRNWKKKNPGAVPSSNGQGGGNGSQKKRKR
jgi:hypothetical protein